MNMSEFKQKLLDIASTFYKYFFLIFFFSHLITLHWLL